MFAFFFTKSSTGSQVIIGPGSLNKIFVEIHVNREEFSNMDGSAAASQLDARFDFLLINTDLNK